MEQARGFFKEIIKIIKKPEMRILPGQLAFFLVLSIIPTIALIGVTANQLSIPLDTIKVTISSSIPKEISTFINDILTGQGFNFNIAVFFISAFILASNGPHSMIITSNEIYKIKPDSFLKRRLKAIGMTFILVGLFFFLFIVPEFGHSIFAFYIETFSSYDLFYGSISNLIVVLLWLYILSYIFVLGLVLNAGSYHHQQLEEQD